MNEKALNTLEFPAIRARVAQAAVTPPGREETEKLLPTRNPDTVARSLRETGEALDYLRRHTASPLRACREVRPVLARIRVDAVLSIAELLCAADFLRSVRAAREIAAEENDDLITDYARLLVPMRDLEEAIFASFLSETEVADSASPRLASLRRQILRQNESIKEKLGALLRSLTKDGVLQDAIITMRNDRYVLPVTAANRSRVPGIVHDQSASGATVFIEPMAVVEINNTIRQLKLDERDEILRILTDFSERLNGAKASLDTDLEVLTKLDTIFARARYALETDAVKPILNDKGYVEIKSGRHPLLDPRKVVPTDVWLGKDFTQLLITGPNTGGKTVTLKTIGLFALMTQSGLFLPAEEGTQMPVFGEVYADIGDEQSIQQSLSTFSSHMKNIAAIMKSVEADSLVLLDELGAGTDPTEGAALAMSILEELRRRRVRTVVTSHYAELKAYSLSHAGSENASVAFDVASLQPTYRLLVGVPGNSNAFLISAKLGLDRYLIDRARSYVDEDSRKLDKVLSNAEEYRASAEARKSEAEQLRLELAQTRRALEKEKKAWEQEREKLLAKAERDAERIREKARQSAQEAIDELKQLKDSDDPGRIFRAREIRKKLEKTEEAPAKKTAPVTLTEFLPGMDVHVVSLDKEGVLIDKPNAKGKAQVRIGILTMLLDASDLAASTAPKEDPASFSRVERAHESVPLSLDVRGQLCDEAVANVDQYLDLALGRNLKSVTVIHGKGTGALRQAIWEYLRSNKRVRSFRGGQYGEGDGGVTVIELKG